MPWKECSVMDERMQFVVRRLAGEPMAELCREFGISRKTGYKIFDGVSEDLSRRESDHPTFPTSRLQARDPCLSPLRS